jgi:hypothetical protein
MKSLPTRSVYGSVQVIETGYASSGDFAIENHIISSASIDLHI